MERHPTRVLKRPALSAILAGGLLVAMALPALHMQFKDPGTDGMSRSTTPILKTLDRIDATIPYDATFFEALDRRVQAEPWLTRDRAMIDTLKAIGIEKGRPFAPDTATTTALTDAMQEAHAWLDARYEEVFNATFYDDARWALPAPPELVEATTTGFSNSDSYPVDDRGVLYSWAFFSAKQLGTGQFYLMTIKDKNGDAFDGAATYRFAVPPNVPVTLYWSATAYDRATHTLIRDTAWASRSSNTPGLETDDDGSVTLFFAPEPPDGRESKWSPHERTVNSKSFAASTGQRKLSSTRRGDWRTSNGCSEPSDPTDSHGRRSRGRVLNMTTYEGLEPSCRCHPL